MAELLLELLTEEIPARMQPRAAADLARLAGERLAAAGLGGGAIKTEVTPRRLTLLVEDLPAAQPDIDEERRGPRLGAPESAMEGFLKSVGLASLEACEQRDTGKGVFYFARIRRAGRPAAQVLPELLRGVIVDFPWPKSMRFPAAGFRWVRPLVSVLSLFEGKILPLALDAIPVGDSTRGHPFLSPEAFAVTDAAEYRRKLRAGRVILDAAERGKTILEALEQAASRAGVAVKDDPALLEEVTGLVEWPVVLMGAIDRAYMSLPVEVLTTSMRTHQKYFACLDSAGLLAPQFLMVANMAAADGGAAIRAGNERVLRARLADAQFFWEQDRKAALSSLVPKLAERLFYQGLGTMRQKVARLEALSEKLAPHVPGAAAAAARSAAFLAKADLSTGMVGEFPELQGVMGRYYALHDGEPTEVAEAIAEHYAPLGPGDRCPAAPVSVSVALADKLDTLVGFWLIGEKPTGSKDPFALRRAALGAIRLIVENDLRIRLSELIAAARNAYGEQGVQGPAARHGAAADEATDQDLRDFFADRLKVHLREKGTRHDLIAAVFALGEDDLVRLLARVAALHRFLDSEDGANLLVAYRRASNIVRIEEKKDGFTYQGPADRQLLHMTEEKALAARLAQAAKLSDAALGRDAFDEAMVALAVLRAPVDEFFDRVTVNAEDRKLRVNRLKLLSEIRATLNRVADFAEIEG